MRSHDCILGAARTIAGREGAANLGPRRPGEAINYHTRDSRLWTR